MTENLIELAQKMAEAARVQIAVDRKKLEHIRERQSSPVDERVVNSTR